MGKIETTKRRHHANDRERGASVSTDVLPLHAALTLPGQRSISRLGVGQHTRRLAFSS